MRSCCVDEKPAIQALERAPDQEIHVVLDKSQYPQTKRRPLAASPPERTLSLTPTGASWRNQIEIWFSILQRSALRKKSFTSPRQLRKAIDDFADVYSETSAPFEWTKATIKPTPFKKAYTQSRK